VLWKRFDKERLATAWVGRKQQAGMKMLLAEDEKGQF